MSAFDRKVDPEIREVRRLEVITGALALLAPFADRHPCALPKRLGWTALTDGRFDRDYRIWR